LTSDSIATINGIKCCNGNCPENIKLADCRTMISNDRYRHLLETINSKFYDLHGFYCPNKTCSHGMVVDPDLVSDKNTITCEKCSQSICILCKQPEHPNECTESLETQELQSLATTNNWKKCPKCNILVAKIDGCDHMNCSNCGSKWCWYCGIEEDHGYECRYR